VNLGTNATAIHRLEHAVYSKESTSRVARPQTDPGAKHATVVDTVINAIDGIKYGSVEITIHDSTVVQVERRERFRLQKEPRT